MKVDAVRQELKSELLDYSLKENFYDKAIPTSVRNKNKVGRNIKSAVGKINNNSLLYELRFKLFSLDLLLNGYDGILDILENYIKIFEYILKIIKKQGQYMPRKKWEI